MEIADHIITYQGDVPQHGIYAGEGNVIYFDSKGTRSILVENLDHFCQQKRCFIRNYPFRPYARPESLDRAFEQMSKMTEHPFSSDEQFVAWCIKGDLNPKTHRSDRNKQEEEIIKMTIKKILTSAVDVLAQHPKWQQQAETANKYLPVIIGSIQLGIEIKKMVDAKKQL